MYIISSNPRVRYRPYCHGHTPALISDGEGLTVVEHYAKIIIIIKLRSQRNLSSRLGRWDTEDLASCGFSVLGQEEADWRGTGVACGQILQ